MGTWRQCFLGLNFYILKLLLMFCGRYTLNIWDVGGQKTIRSYWRNYFEQTDGLIWVVDSSDLRRLDDCKMELDNLLKEEVSHHYKISRFFKQSLFYLFLPFMLRFLLICFAFYCFCFYLVWFNFLSIFGASTYCKISLVSGLPFHKGLHILIITTCLQ